jgi:hypothetical protein
MQLLRYLVTHHLSVAEFAALAKISTPSMHRFLKGDIPSEMSMEKIKMASNYEITEEDFSNVNPNK